MDVLGDNEDDAEEELNMPVDFPLINGTGGKHKNRPHLQKNGKIHEDHRWGEFKGQCEETSVPHIYKQCGAPNKLDGKWGEACPFKAQIEGPHH